MVKNQEFKWLDLLQAYVDIVDVQLPKNYYFLQLSFKYFFDIFIIWILIIIL